MSKAIKHQSPLILRGESLKELKFFEIVQEARVAALMSAGFADITSYRLAEAERSARRDIAIQSPVNAILRPVDIFIDHWEDYEIAFRHGPLVSVVRLCTEETDISQYND